MIESKNEANRNLEKALQALEQAKQRVANELNRILSAALQTKECQQVIAKIKSESRETTPPQSTIPNAENEREGDTE